MLNVLRRMPGATSLFAKCPADLAGDPKCASVVSVAKAGKPRQVTRLKL